MLSALCRDIAWCVASLESQISEQFSIIYASLRFLGQKRNAHATSVTSRVRNPRAASTVSERPGSNDVPPKLLAAYCRHLSRTFASRHEKLTGSRNKTRAA